MLSEKKQQTDHIRREKCNSNGVFLIKSRNLYLILMHEVKYELLPFYGISVGFSYKIMYIISTFNQQLVPSFTALVDL